MVGVNNRNLGSFVTDVENSFRIARQLREATHGPASPLLVSESGISDPETICACVPPASAVSSSAKPS